MARQISAVQNKTTNSIYGVGQSVSIALRKDALGWYADVSGHNKIQISYLQSMADELVEEMRSHYDLKL
jgi:hypothetical protein